MQVKVFESKDMASGLKMVKKELGPDALILSTRTIKNGKMGLLGKSMLEITAAIDPHFPTEKPGASHRTSTHQKLSFNHVVDEPVDHLLNQQEVFANNMVSTPSIHIAAEKNVGSDLSIQSEVNELKNMVKDLAGEISRLNITAQAPQNSSHQELRFTTGSLPERSESSSLHGDHILSMLIDRGINIETSRTIAGFLRESLTDQELSDHDLVISTIIETMQSLIEVTPPDFDNTESQQILAFVGPTGVGKTTTLAKVAASYLSNHSHSVALITIDTYRIAAVEQLKVYGEIMHLPVDVVITPDQLKQSIQNHHDKDLILIDTAGRSPRDGLCIEELATFLQPELNIDKQLVLSATTRENELLNTIEQFNQLGIANTLFTKIDECNNLGILLNIQIQNANPLSYLTNGQRVPEDLLKISPKTVAELIMSQHEGSLHD